MICPKCGYTRKAKETVPDTQCPSCGVFYAKVQTADPFLPKPIVYAEKPRGGWAGKLILAGVAAAALAFGAPHAMRLSAKLSQDPSRPETLVAPDGRTPLREVDFSSARITMYSLTTCVYCKQLRHIFEANGIPFREVFVDENPARMEELVAKLTASGFQGGGIGTPTLEVNGRMMPNNPPLDDIVAQATGGVYRKRAG